MGGKKITKGALTKKSGPTHPNSRRAAQLQRIDLRTNRLQVAKRLRKKGTDVKTERIISLVLLMPPDLAYVPDLAYLHAFMQSSFLERHADELAEAEAEHRPGRPTPMRVVQIKDKIARERAEYEGGMEIPDLLNEANVRLLRAWEGDPNALGLFRFARICGKDQQLYEEVQKGLHKSLAESDAEKKVKAGISTNTIHATPL